MYRHLAPITNEAWKEIDKRAVEVFKSVLTARKAVHVDGPKGSEFTSYNLGKLGEIKEGYGTKYGIYQVAPLIETRVEFKLNRWELDNISRGDATVDFTKLEEAVRKIALFEENAIYSGVKEANIKGLLELGGKGIKLGENTSEVKKNIADAVLKLKKAYTEAPYDLIVSEEIYKKLWAMDNQYPLVKEIKTLIGGSLISCEAIKGGLLLPHDYENLNLVLGDDFSIGYQQHDSKEVVFYIKESFTFRILDEEVVVKFL